MMSKSKKQELIELVTQNADKITPSMLSDVIWCAQHELEIQKMMGLTECSLEEHYQIMQLFYTEGQNSLAFAMNYSDLYGKTEDEKKEVKKNLNQYVKKTPKEKRPYDYDSTLQSEKNSFIEWCDDHDCAVLMKMKPSEDLLRLSYIALAVGYRELAVQICAQIDSDFFDHLKLNNLGNDELETKWIQEFVNKQPDGPNKELLVKNIETCQPLIKEERAKHT